MEYDYFLKHIGDQQPTRELAQKCVAQLLKNINQVIKGQEESITNLVICLLMGEHCLLEGLPGVAKTTLAKELTNQLGLDFQRAQFVPDMMPQDLTHRETLAKSEKKENLVLKDVYGKVFTNILVADEINRAPSKVQAALLEVCEERKVSVLTKNNSMQALPSCERSILEGGTREEHKSIEEKLSLKYFRKPLSNLVHDDEFTLQQFMVVATMNPIEQEGVYPLSEAQIDRFAFKLQIQQPHQKYYRSISQRIFNSTENKKQRGMDKHFHALYFLTWLQSKVLFSSYAGDKWQKSSIREKLEQFVNFTHMRKWSNTFNDNILDHASINDSNGEKQNELKRQIRLWQNNGTEDEKTWANRLEQLQLSDGYPEVYSGASIRGLEKLIKAIHVLAFIKGKELPDWQHVKCIAPLVLGHRIKVSANRYGIADPSSFIESLLNCFE